MTAETQQSNLVSESQGTLEVRINTAGIVMLKYSIVASMAAWAIDYIHVSVRA